MILCFPVISGSMGQRYTDTRKDGAIRIYHRETQRFGKGETIMEKCAFFSCAFVWEFHAT